MVFLHFSGFMVPSNSFVKYSSILILLVTQSVYSSITQSFYSPSTIILYFYLEYIGFPATKYLLLRLFKKNYNFSLKLSKLFSNCAMASKTVYMKHVLTAVCAYMGENGASARNILQHVKSKLRRKGNSVHAEVREAIREGVRNNILQKHRGKYKLKLSSVYFDSAEDAKSSPDRNRRCCRTCGTKIYLPISTRSVHRDTSTRSQNAMSLKKDQFLNEEISSNKRRNRKNKRNTKKSSYPCDVMPNPSRSTFPTHISEDNSASSIKNTTSKATVDDDGINITYKTVL